MPFKGLIRTLQFAAAAAATFNTGSLLVLILFAGCVIAKADAVEWTGPPVVEQQICNGCPYGGLGSLNTSTTENAADAHAWMTFGTTAWGPDPSGSIALEIPFTLTVDSLVAVDVSASYSAGGGNCLPVGCFPETSWIFTGQFSGSSGIEGGPSVDLGGSGSFPGVCDSGACSGSLMLSDPEESGSEFLAAGNYIFDISLAGNNTSVGDSQATLEVNATISDMAPVPEPANLLLLGAALFAMGGWARHRRHLVADGAKR